MAADVGLSLATRRSVACGQCLDAATAQDSSPLGRLAQRAVHLDAPTTCP